MSEKVVIHTGCDAHSFRKGDEYSVTRDEDDNCIIHRKIGSIVLSEDELAKYGKLYLVF